MLRWYVAYTKPNSEHKAQININAQNFTVFLPQYLKKRRHARKTETVATPLFPRYIFIQFDIECHQWRKLASTIGISHIVSEGDRPTPIPDSVIEYIRARTNSEGYIDMLPEKPLAKGDKVRITEGPFSDMEGIFDSYSANNRIHILLNILGQNTRVKISSSFIADP
ncbi:transcription/translation regulatory transformer protein RfaH [Magnetovibrio sp.]|uniref:transcription/translation regulatory transformer protein RfaH n=1 Tax=Magnetovibrio sp. TaxID=2024836 RepID=UPI002F93CE9C